MAFGSDPGSLEYLVGRARAITARPLIVKLSPNVTSIAHMARIAAEAGADASASSILSSLWPSMPRPARRA